MNVLNNIQENLPLIIAAIILVVVQNFLKRRRGPAASQPGLVQDLLGEVRYNLGLVNVFSHQYQAKRFVATMWKLDKDKLDFLPQPLQESLSNAFAMVEDFNQQIAVAKKQKSTAYMAGLNIDKLKALLTTCQEGLEGWLLLKVGSKNPPLKAPDMFDNLLGKR